MCEEVGDLWVQIAPSAIVIKSPSFASLKNAPFELSTCCHSKILTIFLNCFQLVQLTWIRHTWHITLRNWRFPESATLCTIVGIYYAIMVFLNSKIWNHFGIVSIANATRNWPNCANWAIGQLGNRKHIIYLKIVRSEIQSLRVLTSNRLDTRFRKWEDCSLYSFWRASQ